MFLNLSLNPDNEKLLSLSLRPFSTDGALAIAFPIPNVISVAALPIPLAADKTFTILTENNTTDNKYVQAFFIDGEPQEDLFFSHEAIKNGSTLRLVMGPQPKQL